MGSRPVWEMDGVGKLDRSALSGFESQGRLCLMAFSALLRARC